MSCSLHKIMVKAAHGCKKKTDQFGNCQDKAEKVVTIRLKNKRITKIAR